MITAAIYVAARLEDKGMLIKNTLGKGPYDIEPGAPAWLFDP